VRRIGVLMNLAADDAEGQVRLAAFLQGLQEAGWSVGWAQTHCGGALKVRATGKSQPKRHADATTSI
jgi:hypothetical protein